MEELSEDEIERWHYLVSHPVDINCASESRLSASGLFTPYQAATIVDYRTRSGDILSLAELSLVDGFNEETAIAVAPFIVIRSSRAPGERPYSGIRQQLMLRSGWRDGSIAFGGKYHSDISDRVEFNWNSRTTYSDREFTLGTMSLAYYGRRLPWKVVAGDFRARYGQGLAQWSGFSLSGYTSMGTLRRSGTGIGAGTSFTRILHGAAAQIRLGRWSLDGGCSFSGEFRPSPFAHAGWMSRIASLGVTATPSAVTMDWNAGGSGLNFYGEAGLVSQRFEGVCGIAWVPSYGNRIGAVLKYSGGKFDAAAGARYKSVESVFSYSGGSWRLVSRWSPLLASGNWTVKPQVRWSQKYKSGWHTDLRGEVEIDWRVLMAAARFEWVRCRESSWMAYAEAGYRGGELQMTGRWTLFCVDNWDDRIYVYERDLPGCFNVPALYGRGWGLSLTASWKPSRRHSFHLRASTVQYPWMRDPKPSRTEIKLQYQLGLP